MEEIAVVCTGGRDYHRQDVVNAVLFRLLLLASERLRVGVGDADGADGHVREWCREQGISWKEFVAEWYPDGEGGRLARSAGPMRNGKMLRAMRPDLVVAFPGGRGTRDCIRQARDMGILVLHVHDEDYE